MAGVGGVKISGSVCVCVGGGGGGRGREIRYCRGGER